MPTLTIPPFNDAWQRYVRHTKRKQLTATITVYLITLAALIWPYFIETSLIVHLGLNAALLAAGLIIHKLWHRRYAYIHRYAMMEALSQTAQQLYTADRMVIRCLVEDPTGNPSGCIFGVIMASADQEGMVHTTARQLNYDGSTGTFLEHNLIGVTDMNTET